MDLIRDVLDKGVVDRNGREMGRVDGIVLEFVDGRPPRVAALEIGPSVVGDRVHPALGRWIRAVEAYLRVAEGRPTTVAVGDIRHIDGRIAVDLLNTDRGAFNVERALRKLWPR